MEKLRLAGGIALIAFLLLFVAINLDQVEVRLLVATVRMPIAFLVLFCAGLGAAAVLLLRFVKRPPKS